LDEESDEYRFGGDIITAIDGQPVAGIDDLISYLVTLYQPGDTVTLDVIRADGSTEQLQVTLGERPERAN
jgi:2-alkenal reductase